jgi:hypothetical protein
MNWRFCSAGLSAAVLCLPVTLAAQRGLEGGLHSQATFADFTFAGAGLHLSLRPGGRIRFTLSGTPGVVDEAFAFRGESSAQFMLNPVSRKRGFYIGGGLAGLTGPMDEAYLLLLVGLESRPGGASGWVLEGGIGGGIRVQLGYRWRRFKRGTG